MRPNHHHRGRLGTLAAVAALPGVLAACGSSGTANPPTTVTSAAAGSPTPGPAGSGAPGAAPVDEVRTRGVPGLGRVLVDGQGLTLYVFEPDHRSGTPTCYGTCAAAWPPLLLRAGAASPSAGGGASAALVGTASRRDGTTQVTYNRWPLYRWVNDSAPGQATGQGLDNLGGRWYVLDPDGRPITARPRVRPRVAGAQARVAYSASAPSCSAVPTLIRTSPASITSSGEGLVTKAPSGRRMASTRAPVRSRRWAERSVLPARGEAARHRQLLEPELERPVVHDDVDEVDHVGLGHERRHPVAAELLGVHHPVGAGPHELGLRGLVAGPGDDLEVGPHRLARHRHVEVVGVGVERRHQGRGPLDAGLRAGSRRRSRRRAPTE